MNRRLDPNVLLLGFSVLVLIAAWRMLVGCPTCTKVGEEHALAPVAGTVLTRRAVRVDARKVSLVIVAGTAVGFLTGDTTPAIVSQAMEYIITGKAPPGTTYRLRTPSGYPGMIGAMFWTIDADRRANYNFSNVIGPQLHGYPVKK